MKIIFFGTPEFAVPTLERLNSSPDIEILGVVTQEDKPVGRKQMLTPPPVKAAALKLGLSIIQPKNKKELVSKIKNYEVDFFIVIAYGVIFPSELLRLPRYACINAHASLLPKYRGASPIQESLLNGDTETGITFIKMIDELDAGDVYLARRIPIAEEDNLESLSKKLADLTAELFPPLLKDIVENSLPPLHQSKNNISFCRKITSEDGKVDFETSAERIRNMIRAYTPWPSAYTFIDGKKLKILEATIEKCPKRSPGKFLLEKNSLKISTKDGYLVPLKVQLEGKKEMDIKSFLNGYRNLFS